MHTSAFSEYHTIKPAMIATVIDMIIMILFN